MFLIIICILKILIYLDSSVILYFDMKGENIIIGKDGRIKIIYLGH